MLIRDETASDNSSVRCVVANAFGRTTEADLVEALRASGDAAISLVAEEDGRIVGQVLFSKLRAPDNCLALAPVSVAPDRRNRGIGSRLVRAGLAQAKGEGWQAVFVLGAPNYYERFGFSTAAAAKFETAYPRAYFMALDLAPNALAALSGPVINAAPFSSFD